MSRFLPLAIIAPVVAILVVVLLVSVGGFNLSGAPDGPLAKQIEGELRLHKADGSAIIDFDHSVEGEWTKVAFVCWASSDAIHRALGFDWDQPKRKDVRKGFAVVFATDDRVEQFFGPVTAAPFDDRNYVSPCEEGGSGPNVIVFDREGSKVQFELGERGDQPTWFPTPDQGTAFYGARG